MILKIDVKNITYDIEEDEIASTLPETLTLIIDVDMLDTLEGIFVSVAEEITHRTSFCTSGFQVTTIHIQE